jgi:hypothetical protein
VLGVYVRSPVENSVEDIFTGEPSIDPHYHVEHAGPR